MEITRGESSKSYIDENKTGETKHKLDAIEIATQKLTRTIFELELLGIMARETGVKLRLKEKEVAEEKRKSEEMQYQKWTKMNNFCDRLWKISAENDLFNLFNKYLDMPKRTRCKASPIETEQHPEVLKLKREIDELKKQLAIKKARTLCLEEEMLQAKTQLQIAESYRKKNSEIIRLTKSIDKYQNEVSVLESKIQAVEAREVEATKSRQSPSPFASAGNKHNFVTATELIAQEENKNVIKKSTFSVKRKSAISRKLADTRGANRGN